MAMRWSPPVELTLDEEAIVKRLKRVGKLFVFLRRHRMDLFDEAFQAELAGMYSDMPRGTPPKSPALLAMVTILQAYQGVGDAVAVENAMFDRRWQMVLDCYGAVKPPYSQGVLVDFRRRLIEHDMDRRLLERTVELARETGGFGHKALRVALDSAPLAGAGRVEDTFNLIGHAMEVVVDCAAAVAELTADQVREQAGTALLGHSSIKAALDIDWDDTAERDDGLERLLADVQSLRAWVAKHLADHAKQPPLKQALDLLARVVEQDIEPDPDGGGSRIVRGTAKDRVISIQDGEMRHGRKSKSRVINGFKKHIAVSLDTGLTLAAAVRPANEREHQVEEHIRPDVARLGEVSELHIDRGYLAGQWPAEMHRDGKPVYSKPWVNKRAERFTKADFRYDFEAQTATCPGESSAPIRPAKTEDGTRHVNFSSKACRGCAIRDQCIPEHYTRGKTLTLHRQEELLQQLRDAKATPEGRAKLRERVKVEHNLAHHCRRQGPRARYIGARKNTLDARRAAAVENLHRTQRLQEAA